MPACVRTADHEGPEDPTSALIELFRILPKQGTDQARKGGKCYGWMAEEDVGVKGIRMRERGTVVCLMGGKNWAEKGEGRREGGRGKMKRACV